MPKLKASANARQDAGSGGKVGQEAGLLEAVRDLKAGRAARVFVPDARLARCARRHMSQDSRSNCMGRIDHGIDSAGHCRGAVDQPEIVAVVAPYPAKAPIIHAAPI